MAKPRVAAIGIDAAEWEHVKALIDSGLLPNIEKHLDASAVLDVRGEEPYRAEATWTEFLTGRSPQDNRYWSTAVFDPESYQVWEVGAHEGVPFYARPDLKAIVFDVPHSYVVPGSDGLQITAWGAHSPQFPTASSPRDLVAHIDRRFGVHRAPLSDSLIGWHNEAYQRNLTEAMLDGLTKKADICAWLLEEHPDWDLFVTVLSESHTAGHQFLHGILDHHPLRRAPFAPAAAEHFRATYARIDEVVGQLTANFHDDTTVVLFAVHGMWWNGSDTAAVWLPEVLHRLDFGRPFIDLPTGEVDSPLVQLETEMSPLEYLLRYLTEPAGDMYGSKATALKNRLAWQIRRMAPPAMLPSIEEVWRRAIGLRARHEWWEMDVRPAASASIDLTGARGLGTSEYHVPAWYCAHWPKMRFFVLPSFSDVHIRVNVRGRERDGVVDLRNYHAVLDEIDSLLHSIVNARTGEPVVRETYRVRAPNPMDPDGPTADLVITFGDVADAVRHPDLGIIGPCPIFRSGEHTTNGWAAFRTPSGATGALGQGRPRDLAPTILDLLGRRSSPLVTGASFAPLLKRP